MTEPREEVIKRIERIFQERIPFNGLLGLDVNIKNIHESEIRIKMREDLVGNYVMGILHGGVIASTLDVMGGLTSVLSLIDKFRDKSMEELMEKLSTFGTIDLRIDYLRPGRGREFIAAGTVLRTGNKISVTRTQLHNDEGLLIAVGTGTYLVG
ncbi:thioesterase family protein [Limisalsivibrio acetivorans]|uniref:thioesterase family protein n=1 Tax=Limisalsivibrio acetivorans TaxID=1304888 RepID=UPI0003B5CFAE|nr:thioesterase family protein [Limisalsivibrio acetivorans]